MDNSIKDKVLDLADIVALIGERVALVRKGRDYVGLCPFHSDHNPSMSVSPAKRIFKCWSCGAGGDVIRFVQLFDRVSFPEALTTLARRLGIEPRDTPTDHRAAEMREQLLAAVAWARDLFRRTLESPAGADTRNYARRRGLSDKTIADFALGLAPDSWSHLLDAARHARISDPVLHQAGLVATNERGKTYDRFRNRLIFPIADSLGRPVAFGGRTLGDDPAKYLNSPETSLFSKSRILYALDRARPSITTQRAAIVVEGYMDAVLLHQHGFTNVVATLGTALTDAHAEQLQRLANTLYLCFDGDEPGQRAADRAVEVALRSRMDVRVLVLDAGTDPADCVTAGGPEAFSGLLNRAVDALEFKWSQTLRAFEASGPRGRRDALEAFLGFVAGAGLGGGIDAVQQSLVVGRLAELLGIPPEQVFELLRAARRNVRREPRTDSTDDSAASDYDLSIRGLPPGLVSAVESLLGLLSIDAAGWQGVDDVMAAAVERSRNWQRMYRILLDVHEDVGEYSFGDVSSRCDDGALCELLDRARARVNGITAPWDELQAVRERLAAELDVLRYGQLQEDLRSAGPDGDEAFRRLQRHGRTNEGVMGIADRGTWARSGSS